MALPNAKLLRSLLALGVAVTLIAALPASAQSGRIRPPVSVTFTWDPEASAATNYRILQWRVKQACTQQGPRPIMVMPKERACIEGMMSMTVAQLDRPELTVEHANATELAMRQLATR
jgi:hypothetical protein